MREIKPLSVMCLRAVGSQRCSAEDTFAKTSHSRVDGKALGVAMDESDSTKDASSSQKGPKFPSQASRLLQSFHQRPSTSKAYEDNVHKICSIHSIPISRTPSIGEGSVRRTQTNDIDLHHPWIAVYQNKKPESFLPSIETNEEDLPQKTHSSLTPVPSDPQSQVLVSEFGSPSLDLLQSYIDSLVELGRMDDARLGVHFFEEFRTNIELQKANPRSGQEYVDCQPPSKRTKNALTLNKSQDTRSTSVGSLSLYNAVILDETLSSMLEAKVLQHIAVLDLTGVSTLNDTMLQKICQASGPQLRRISVKNCRRLTDDAMGSLSRFCPNLSSLDIGGAYNITPLGILATLLPSSDVSPSSTGAENLPHLLELHASGLGWNNEHLGQLFSMRPWKGLSLGFSSLLSFGGWKNAVWADSSESMCARLQSLAVPFCEGLVDNAWLGMMGRHLPHVRALDVRGNVALNSMTGWYDGRATIVPTVPLQQSLIVLARYSSITKASVEETKGIHPVAALPLLVILDSSGAGLGILRMENE